VKDHVTALTLFEFWKRHVTSERIEESVILFYDEIQFHWLSITRRLRATSLQLVWLQSDGGVWRWWPSREARVEVTAGLVDKHVTKFEADMHEGDFKTNMK